MKWQPPPILVGGPFLVVLIDKEGGDEYVDTVFVSPRGTVYELGEEGREVTDQLLAWSHLPVPGKPREEIVV